MLESIEKLRELRGAVEANDVDNPIWVCSKATIIADEIEREISEKFARIPTTDVGIPRMCAADAEANLKWAFDHEWENFDDIKERYMLLPVDADGVPIRVGDTIEYPSGTYDDVRFITISSNAPRVNEGEWLASKCRHVKSRTVEDVLTEFGEQVCRSGHQWGLDASTVVPEYAAKLRESGVLYMHGHPNTDYAAVQAIEVDGQRFERVRECNDVGNPRDFACSVCGARLFIENNDGYTMCLADQQTIIESPNFCPHCGARVAEVSADELRELLGGDAE